MSMSASSNRKGEGSSAWAEPRRTPEAGLLVVLGAVGTVGMGVGSGRVRRQARFGGSASAAPGKRRVVAPLATGGGLPRPWPHRQTCGMHPSCSTCTTCRGWR